MKRTIAAATLLLVLTACAATSTGEAPRIEAVQTEEPEWRHIASIPDQHLLDRLPALWEQALQSAERRRDRRVIAREGELLQPDAARDHPATPPGSYRCRLIRLQTPGRREPAVRTYRDFFCNVASDDEGHLAFAKQTGTELPSGWLYPDEGDRRWILIGAKQAEPGENEISYGDDPERDVIGVLERVSAFRWRLVVPQPGDGATLDIYELTPLPLEQQAPETLSSAK